MLGERGLEVERRAERETVIDFSWWLVGARSWLGGLEGFSGDMCAYLLVAMMDVLVVYVSTQFGPVLFVSSFCLGEELDLRLDICSDTITKGHPG